MLPECEGLVGRVQTMATDPRSQNHNMSEEWGQVLKFTRVKTKQQQKNPIDLRGPGQESPRRQSWLQPLHDPAPPIWLHSAYA